MTLLDLVTDIERRPETVRALVPSCVNTTPISRDKSRYLQSSWMFAAETCLNLPELAACMHKFSETEALRLREAVRKGNVFTRHTREDNFYLIRIEALAGQTVVDIRLPGNPDDIIDKAQAIANAIENTLLLSLSLLWRREDIQRRLAISAHRRSTLDITVGPACYYLRSRYRPETNVQGLVLDEKACRRYCRCGFPALAKQCVENHSISKRIYTAVHWLAESRQEPLLSAAIVKSAIALESLLVFSESEPLGKALSERSAFLLSADPEMRRQISRMVKQFYDARSGVVHGSRKRATELSPELLEGMDRLIILLCLTLAANSSRWTSHEIVQQWCEGQRWGSPTEVEVPFSLMYLRNALALPQRSAS